MCRIRTCYVSTAEMYTEFTSLLGCDRDLGVRMPIEIFRLIDQPYSFCPRADRLSNRSEAELRKLITGPGAGCRPAPSGGRLSKS